MSQQSLEEAWSLKACGHEQGWSCGQETVDLDNTGSLLFTSTIIWISWKFMAKSVFLFFFFFVFLLFLGPLLQHMEVPRLGVESEL